MRIVAPLADALPMKSLIGLPAPGIIAVLLILVFCLLTGLFARARAAGRVVGWLEEGVLTNVPGYEFIKGVGQSLLGVTPKHAQQAVLVRLDDSWQIAFLMEHLAGGRVVIFVPDAPSPWSGSVHVIEESQIEPVAIPTAAALKSLRRMGAGSISFLDPWANTPERDKLS